MNSQVNPFFEWLKTSGLSPEDQSFLAQIVGDDNTSPNEKGMALTKFFSDRYLATEDEESDKYKEIIAGAQIRLEKLDADFEKEMEELEKEVPSVDQ